MRVLRWVPGALLLLPWLLAPVEPATATRLRDLSGPSAFSLIDWETANLAERSGRLWDGLFGGDQVSNAADGQTLQKYFRDGASRSSPRAEAEAAMERLIGAAYAVGGLTRSEPLPLARLFPPVLIALTPPPNVLVISPRTALRVIDSTVMQPMEVAAQQQLEASADSTGVSALVAPIGGLATYPSMVLDEDPPERVLSSVAHEWMHQYLIFYPLGAGYWDSQETREINETTADMVGQEVGHALATSLGLLRPQASSSGKPAFDFRAFMGETRLHTEQLLSDGQVDAAEGYMQSRRDELQQHGYQIRKLNQAYFALYGSYGDGFAASPNNPIAGLLQRLRQRSATLGDFVFEVRAITSVAQLEAVSQA